MQKIVHKISPEELKSTLELHQLWVETSGEAGTRAVLSYKDLRGHDFRGANITDTNLTDTDLRGAKLDQGIVEVWSIYNAHFSSDALPWLMLRPDWLEEREWVHISDE